ncbi:hypothetical protein EXIGLDRAFT_122451 [Exidia glandulosa HHB12029]|uniref:Fungal N-terminal domain-containing protein n=1 Tax=Exidia glandulosa HHB12029 TaxID=1314781 RepID=A0A165NID3_EXIGL|nr:hypothetical protein EXIGLDRAFT_122451 [Exidia glandulosa HHB12029]
MSLVAFTFGSFGDIATLADLALKIGLALNDCAGTLTEFKALVVEIESFAASMLQIKESLSTRSSLSCALTLKIGDALDVCFDLLKLVQKRVDEFNSKTSKAVGRMVLRKYWAVVGWEILGGRDEVDKLRDRLAQQVGIVNALLTASNRREVQGFREQADENHRDVRTRLVTLEKRLSATTLAFQFFDATGCTRPAMSVSPEIFLRTSLSEALPDSPGWDKLSGVHFMHTSYEIEYTPAGHAKAAFHTGGLYQQSVVPVLGFNGPLYPAYGKIMIYVACAVRIEDGRLTEALISPAYALTAVLKSLGTRIETQYYMSPSASAALHGLMLHMHRDDPYELPFSYWKEDKIAQTFGHAFHPRELRYVPKDYDWSCPPDHYKVYKYLTTLQVLDDWDMDCKTAVSDV